MNQPGQLYVFLDDTKELFIPTEIQNVIDSGTDVEIKVIRNFSEFYRFIRTSDKRIDYIAFDYYLDVTGGNTGRDAIDILIDEYTRREWSMPKATFISSDRLCNRQMEKVWRDRIPNPQFIEGSGQNERSDDFNIEVNPVKVGDARSWDTTAARNIRSHFRKKK